MKYTQAGQPRPAFPEPETFQSGMCLTNRRNQDEITGTRPLCRRKNDGTSGGHGPVRLSPLIVINTTLRAPCKVSKRIWALMV